MIQVVVVGIDVEMMTQEIRYRVRRAEGCRA